MDDSEISIFLDRTQKDALPSYVLDALKEHNLIDSYNGHETISFCGAVLTESNVSIFLPRSSAVTEEMISNKASVGADLIRAVHKYSKQSETKAISNDSGANLIGFSGLEIIFNLLSDYRTYGLYRSKYKENVRNTGKANWKKTVTRETPFPAANGSPIYLNIHGNKLNHQGISEISKIHAEIIKSLGKKYSWILTGNEKNIASDLSDVGKPLSGTSRQVKALDTELRSVYSDREIWLLKSLKNYLIGVTGREPSRNVIGLRDFHHAWEHMTRTVLEYTFDLNDIMPVPVYKDRQGNLIKQERKKQKADIGLISKPENKLAIVDAKYYSTARVENYPGFSDLIKQFFYAKSVKQVISEDTEILNYLLFPGKNQDIQSIHVYDKELSTELAQEYQPILCKWLDPIEVIQHYITGRKMTDYSKTLLNLSSPT